MKRHPSPPKMIALNLFTIFTALSWCFFVLSQNLNRLGWMGASWLEHSDHWHIIQMAQSWLSPLSLHEPEIVYSRLPSIFPDGLIAILGYSLLGFNVQSMYFMVSMMFIIYIGTSIVLLRAINVSIDVISLSCTLLFTSLILVLSPSLTWVFVPIHHGGNVISVMLSFSFIVYALQPKKAFGGTLLFLASCAGVFLFALSNRFFIVSFVIPCLLLLILMRSKSYWLYLSCVSGSIMALVVNAHMLVQGRDVIAESDFSQLFPGLVSRITTAPILMMVAVVLVYFLKTYLDSVAAISPPGPPVLLSANDGLFVVFVAFSLILGVTAEYIVSGIGTDTFNIRYIFGSVMLMPPLCVMFFFKFVPKRVCKSRLLSLVLVGLCLIGIATSGVGDSSKAAQRNYNAALMLESADLPTNYGLATYPYWQALAIKGFTQGDFDVMDASSDGTPLFWYRWKGSLFRQKPSSLDAANAGKTAAPKREGGLLTLSGNRDALASYKPYSFVFVSPYMQERVEGHYGKPSRKLYCQQERFECLWIYDDPTDVLLDVDVFVNTYGDKVKS